MVEYSRTLGARLMVGQRTLNPYVGVRILRPQPSKGIIILDDPFACCRPSMTAVKDLQAGA